MLQSEILEKLKCITSASFPDIMTYENKRFIVRKIALYWRYTTRVSDITSLLYSMPAFSYYPATKYSRKLKRQSERDTKIKQDARSFQV